MRLCHLTPTQLFRVQVGCCRLLALLLPTLTLSLCACELGHANKELNKQANQNSSKHPQASKQPTNQPNNLWSSTSSSSPLSQEKKKKKKGIITSRQSSSNQPFILVSSTIVPFHARRLDSFRFPFPFPHQEPSSIRGLPSECQG